MPKVPDPTTPTTVSATVKRGPRGTAPKALSAIPCTCGRADDVLHSSQCPRGKAQRRDEKRPMERPGGAGLTLTPTTMDGHLTVAEAAEANGKTETTIYRALQTGALPYSRDWRGKLIIARADLLAYYAPTMPDGFLTVKQAAEVIGITRMGVLAAINKGALSPDTKRRREWMIAQTVVFAYRDTRSGRGGKSKPSERGARPKPLAELSCNCGRADDVPHAKGCPRRHVMHRRGIVLPPPTPPDGFLTVAQASAVSGKTKGTIQHLISKGTLPHSEWMDKRIVRQSDLEAYCAARPGRGRKLKPPALSKGGQAEAAMRLAQTEFLTGEQAAKESGKSVAAIWRAIRVGALPHSVQYGVKVVTRADLENYCAPPDGFLTLAQAAAASGKSKQSVHKAFMVGSLPYQNWRSTKVVKQADLEAYCATARRGRKWKRKEEPAQEGA